MAGVLEVLALIARMLFGKVEWHDHQLIRRAVEHQHQLADWATASRTKPRCFLR
jgi:hypothetical protein